MDHTQTLQQGLDAFREKNNSYFSKKKVSPVGNEFFLCHDIAHVVFGCGTTIYGEGLVKIWTTFGTSLGFWEVFKNYKEVNALKLARSYSVGHVVKNLFRLLTTMPKAILKTKRMSKPWPFLDYQPYLDKPLGEIRKEFNIEIIT